MSALRNMQIVMRQQLIMNIPSRPKANIAATFMANINTPVAGRINIENGIPGF